MAGMVPSSCSMVESQKIVIDSAPVQMVPAKGFEQVTDNFILILDTSGSSEEKYNGRSKIQIAKEIAGRFNQMVPDIKLTAALRVFGEGRLPGSRNKTRLVYWPVGYSKDSFGQALQAIQNEGGLSFMAAAIEAAGYDIRSNKGRTAIIIISDGRVHISDPVIQAKKLRENYGDDVCIYTIFIPSETEKIHQLKNRSMMREIAAESQCGFSVHMDQLATEQQMASFVEQVFFHRSEDMDGDGVVNEMDLCPDTPKDMLVNEKGCPVEKPETRTRQTSIPSEPLEKADADKDGIPDQQDQCPDTPQNARVNQVGCWVIPEMTFETGSWIIRPSARSRLLEVVSVLRENPELRVEVQGHTDNIGSPAYNMDLSRKRAETVRNYLIQEGIEPERLGAKGYGYTKPAMSNATPEGRSANRRVEFKPLPR